VIFRYLYNRKVNAVFRPYLTDDLRKRLESADGEMTEWKAFLHLFFPGYMLRRAARDNPNALTSLRNEIARVLNKRS